MVKKKCDPASVTQRIMLKIIERILEIIKDHLLVKGKFDEEKLIPS